MRKIKFLKISCVVLLLLLCLTGCGKDEKQYGAVNELNGKVIASEIGAMHAAVIKTKPELEDVNLMYVNSSSDGLAMLLNGKVDALAVDYVTAKVMTGRYDGIVMLDESLDNSVYAFAFSKNNPLIPVFDEAIAELKYDGTINRLMQKWMDDDNSEKSVPEQTWSGLNGVLRCRVSADIEPMCYIDNNGSLAGFDVDLLMHIAERLDYSVELSKGKFEDLLPSVASGQIDMAASGITVTQERSKTVDFSSGYLEAGTVVLVRDISSDTKSEGLLISLENSIRRTLLEENRWKELLLGLWVSVKIIVLSVVAGAVFGALIYIWYYSDSKIAKLVLGIISTILCYLPLSTWLLAVFYLIFSGNSINNFWAAVFAFAFSFGFDVFASLKDSVGNIGIGQVEAAVSMGYGRFEALYRIYLPQALPSVMSVLDDAVIDLIRCTSIVEFIAVQDFQGVADRIRAESFEPFLPIILTALVYVLLAVFGSWLVRKLRSKICLSEKTETEVHERIMREMGR